MFFWSVGDALVHGPLPIYATTQGCRLDKDLDGNMPVVTEVYFYGQQ